MRLYSFRLAPNPLKAMLLVREKRLDVDFVYVDESNYPSFCRLSPLRKTPILEREDGSVITESLTICQYLDALSGAPFLFGAGLDERTEIGMWERRAELELLNQAIKVYHHAHPMFRVGGRQSRDAAAYAFARARQFLTILDRHLKVAPFLAGDGFTAADITAYLGYFWLSSMGILPADSLDGVAAWAARIAARDSVEVLHRIGPQLDVQAALNRAPA